MLFLKSHWKMCLGILLLTLSNYQVAKLFQRFILAFLPDFSYQLSLSIPWLLIAALPVLCVVRNSGIQFEYASFRAHWKTLLGLCLLVVGGLGLFILLGITHYFHSVKYPLIFFIITPVVEELIFRGFIFGQLEKVTKYAVVGSALLFGLHHLQYFNYVPTAFAIFQISYTFILGLLLGKMRQKSGSLYLSLVIHMLINWATVTW